MEGPKWPESHDQQLLLNLGLLAQLDLPAGRPGDFQLRRLVDLNSSLSHGLLRLLYVAVWASSQHG